jgi:phospholipid transport system transporter-binding protein
MGICKTEKDTEGYKILGQINFDTVSHLYKQGKEILEKTAQVKLNFGEVTHADSSAIALLLSWLRVAKQKGKTFVFMNLPIQLLEIANVCEVMPILKDHVINNSVKE